MFVDEPAVQTEPPGSRGVAEAGAKEHSCPERDGCGQKALQRGKSVPHSLPVIRI